MNKRVNPKTLYNEAAQTVAELAPDGMSQPEPISSKSTLASMTYRAAYYEHLHNDAIESNSQMADTIADLQDEAAKRKEVLDARDMQCAEHIATIENLEGQTRLLENECRNRNNAIEQLTNERDMIRREAAECRKICDDRQERLEAQALTIDRLTKEKDDLSSIVSRNRIDAKAHAQTIDALKHERTHYRDRASYLSDELQQAYRAYRNMRTMLVCVLPVFLIAIVMLVAIR